MNSLQRTSAAIRRLRFPLIFFVILLHGYSVVSLLGHHETYFDCVYPLALWLGETGVPAFLFISGYLFFLSKKSYGEKLRSRFHSLLIPYLLWNALLLAAYLAAFAAGHPQLVNGRSMAEYGMIDYLRLFWDRGTFDNGNFVPLLCPYWYIRNLIILSLLSPLIHLLTKYLRELFLFAVAVWWILTPHNAFVAQSILFFSLGAYFPIHGRDPMQLFESRRFVFLILCVVFACTDIVLHNHALPIPHNFTIGNVSLNLTIHRLALLANIPMLFLVADSMKKKEQKTDLSSCERYLGESSFIVFSIHYPIIVVLRKGCMAFMGQAGDGIQVVLYLSCVAIATLLSLLFFAVLNRCFPRVKTILSGSR